MKETLLIFNGINAAEQLYQETQFYPRKDYIEILRRLNAETLKADTPRFPFDKLLIRQLGKLLSLDFNQVFLAYRKRKRYKLFFSFSEKKGIPLSFLLNIRKDKNLHIMIGHYLLSPLKRLIPGYINILGRIDRIICLTEYERKFLEEKLGLASEKLIMIHHHVDTDFFKPLDNCVVEDYIFSIGGAERDYKTLLKAVEGLNVKVRVLASSAWPIRKRHLLKNKENIEILKKCSYEELKNIYAKSKFIVIPLRKSIHFTAGTNSILEAMAMGKTVVASRNPGTEEYIQNDKTGLLVEPENPGALREAIEFLLNHFDKADAMGRAGRKLVEEKFNLDLYVDKICEIVNNVLSKK